MNLNYLLISATVQKNTKFQTTCLNLFSKHITIAFTKAELSLSRLYQRRKRTKNKVKYEKAQQK